MRPCVSVIIPCYNAEPYIGDTLESVFAQTWPNIEVIVVDDGSTDTSGLVISSLARDNLALIRQANRGQTAALNAGLARATGDFVQFLDADDLIDEQKIEVQVARLVDNPGCIASASWGRFYDDPGNARFELDEVSRDLAPLDWLAASRVTGLGMMFPALWLVPMPIARAVGPWREDLTLDNDAEYFTRIILAAERVLFCPDARCRYRSGLGGSLSGQKSPAHWSSQMTVLELCQQRVLAREYSERMRRVFALGWQRLAHACYPYDPILAEQAVSRARALHSCVIRPAGGPGFAMLSRLVGWRAARRLQVASGRN